MIRHGRYEDIPRLKELWEEAFGETGLFTEDFFSSVFTPEDTLCYVQGGRTAAMLYKIPCAVRRKDGEREKAYYLYALATGKACRGQGMMRRLIEAAREEIRLAGCRISFLIPAEEGLVPYYRRFGFRPVEKPARYRMEGGEVRRYSFESGNVRLMPAGPEEAAALVGSREWRFTNYNVWFSETVAVFRLTWILREKGAFFYKVTRQGTDAGFLQGKEKNGLFEISGYGLEDSCWPEIRAALNRPGFRGIKVSAHGNPQVSCFLETGQEEGLSASAAASVTLEGIHGLIPV